MGKNVYKSKYEQKVAKHLEERGLKFTYEEYELEYHDDVYRGSCDNCGSSNVVQTKVYVPDFYIKSLDLFIEAKGKFTPKDRSKHLKVRESNPDVSIVLLFMRNNWLTKKKVVRYSGWCERHKIEYHIDVDGKIPERWLYVP